jgi:hypothetical protein
MMQLFFPATSVGTIRSCLIWISAQNDPKVPSWNKTAPIGAVNDATVLSGNT